jgi:hypothetical protein
MGGLGVEGMVADPGDGGARMAFAPVVNWGLRASYNLGLVGLWLGIDACARLLTLQVGVQKPVIARHYRFDDGGCHVRRLESRVTRTSGSGVVATAKS